MWWTCAGALATIGWTFLPWVIVRAKNGAYASVNGLSGEIPHSAVCSVLLVIVSGLTAAACLAWLASRRPAFAIAAAFGPPLMLVLTIINVAVLADDPFVSVAVGSLLAGMTALAAGVIAISSALMVLRPNTGSADETERMLWTAAGALATIGSLFMPWAVVSDSSYYRSAHGLLDSSPFSIVCSVLLLVVCVLTALAAAVWLTTREPLAAFVAAGGPLLMLALTIANATVLFAQVDHRVGPNHTSTGGGTFLAGAIAIALIALTLSDADALATPRRSPTVIANGS